MSVLSRPTSSRIGPRPEPLRRPGGKVEAKLRDNAFGSSGIHAGARALRFAEQPLEILVAVDLQLQSGTDASGRGREGLE